MQPCLLHTFVHTCAYIHAHTHSHSRTHKHTLRKKDTELMQRRLNTSKTETESYKAREKASKAQLDEVRLPVS